MHKVGMGMDVDVTFLEYLSSCCCLSGQRDS